MVQGSGFRVEGLEISLHRPGPQGCVSEPTGALCTCVLRHSPSRSCFFRGSDGCALDRTIVAVPRFSDRWPTRPSYNAYEPSTTLRAVWDLFVEHPLYRVGTVLP